MLVFPQLTTGAAALYPVRRTRRRRSVVNAVGDGTNVVYSDPDAAATLWRLEATGLSLAEWSAIEALFASVKGRLGAFTLVEPAGNLLVESETLGAAEWNPGAGVVVTTGIADPFGGTGGAWVHNGSGAAEEFSQGLAVPGDFQYALSVWARSHGAAAVTLFASSMGGEATGTFAVDATWRRVVLPVALGLTTESVTFGVRLGVGDGVDLFGMQVDAQRGAGEYQRTGARGGVHGGARFGDDVLTVRAQGTDEYDAVVRIVSKGS